MRRRGKSRLFLYAFYHQIFSSEQTENCYILLSSLIILSARRISFNVDPLVVTSSTVRIFCFLIVAHKFLSSSFLKFRK